MRKLLINSTALATVAGLAASASFADVSITATSEFAFSDRESKVVASNGTFQTQSSEVGMTFTNKTDNGLTVSYNTQFTSAGTVAIDESALSISGGFGKIVLGQKDGVTGTYGMGAEDLIAEESNTGLTVSATISTGSDIALGTNDNNKVAYHLPAMGGLTVGASFEDSGASATANTATDTTALGARYVTELNGMAITLAAANATTETASTLADTKADNMGVKVVRGNISAIYATTNYTADGEDRSTTGYSISYNMGDGLTIGAYSNTSEDSVDLDSASQGESYSVNGVEAQYTLAAGLTAVLNVDNYDYDAPTSNAAGSDDGSLTKLTIKAAF